MASGDINPGALLNSVPSPVKSTLTGNFIDIRSQGWTQQYLPELMEMIIYSKV